MTDIVLAKTHEIFFLITKSFGSLVRSTADLWNEWIVSVPLPHAMENPSGTSGDFVWRVIYLLPFLWPWVIYQIHPSSIHISQDFGYHPGDRGTMTHDGSAAPPVKTMMISLFGGWGKIEKIPRYSDLMYPCALWTPQFRSMLDLFLPIKIFGFKSWVITLKCLIHLNSCNDNDESMPIFSNYTYFVCIYIYTDRYNYIYTSTNYIHVYMYI